MTDPQNLPSFQQPLTTDTWQLLDGFLAHLPRPVRLVTWASEHNSCTEENAVHLCRLLAERYIHLTFDQRPRQPDYAFYPVLGVMGLDEQGSAIDYGIRFVGLPAWYQLNTLVGAIQAVSFRASTLEAVTRIHLKRLPAEQPLACQLFTDPEDEGGVLMGTLAANLAVFSPTIRVWVAQINEFPHLALRYSVRALPHTVINGHYHLQGVYDETQLLQHLARLLKQTAATPRAT